jgi:hypothetical protein
VALGPRKRRGNPTAFGGTRTQEEEGSVQEGVKAYIERIFSSGGTRIRTGDTMIFSHFRGPLGMRIFRICKQVFVHGVPPVVAWCRPYCCATVDTPLTAFRGYPRHRRPAT